MFFPTSNNSRPFYIAVAPLGLLRYVRLFTPFLNGLRLLYLGLVTCLWCHYSLSAPVWQFSWYDKRPYPGPLTSNMVILMCWGLEHRISCMWNIDQGKAVGTSLVCMVHRTEWGRPGFLPPSALPLIPLQMQLQPHLIIRK